MISRPFGATDCAEEEGAKKREPREQASEVVAGGGENGVGGVACRMGEEVAAHSVLGPSVTMMLRQSPTGSLPLRAEVETSHGYAPYH